MNFTVYCEDPIGNIGTAQSIFYKDVVDPIISMTTPTAHNNTFVMNISVADWTPASTFFVYSVENASGVVLNGSSGTSGLSSVVYLSPSYAFDGEDGYNYTLELSQENVSHGNYTVNVTAYDRAGHSTFLQQNFTVNDTTAPVISITGFNMDGAYDISDVITSAVAIPNPPFGSYFYFNISTNEIIPHTSDSLFRYYVFGSSSGVSGLDPGANLYAITGFIFSGLETYAQYAVTLVDAAGNVGFLEGGVYIDDVDPIISVPSLAPNDGVFRANVSVADWTPASPYINYSVFNGSDVLLSGSLNISDAFSVDDLSFSTLNVSYNFTFALNETGLFNGNYTLNVTAFDRANHSTFYQQNFTANDTTPPTLTVRYPLNGTKYSAANASFYSSSNYIYFSINVSVLDSSTLKKCFIDYHTTSFSAFTGTGFSVNYGESLGDNSFFGDTLFLQYIGYSFPSSPHGGVVDFLINCSDVYNNFFALPVSSFFSDPDAPELFVNSPLLINDSFFTLNLSVAEWLPAATLLTFNLSNASGVSVQNGSGDASLPRTLIINRTVGNLSLLLYNYSLTSLVQNLPDGNYTLNVTAYDEVGNIASVEETITVNDSTAPVSVVSVGSVTSSSAVVSFSVDESASFVVFYGVGSLSESATGGSGLSSSVSLSSLISSTEYSYVLQSCDVKNNCVNSTAATFTTLAPTSSSSGGGGSASSYTGSVGVSSGPVARRLSVGSSFSFSVGPSAPSGSSGSGPSGSSGSSGGGSSGGSHSHSLTVKSIELDGVWVVLQSEPIELFLRAGEKKSVDLDGDGLFDVVVALDSFDALSAKVSVEEYVNPAAIVAEEVPLEAEEGVDAGVGEADIEAPVVSAPVDVPDDVSGSGAGFSFVPLGGLLLLILLFVVLFFVFKRK